MSPRSLLLRVLLSVALICNGTSSAMAATHMLHAALPDAATPQAVAPAATAAMPPCHEAAHGMAQHDPEEVTAAPDSPLAAADAAPAPPKSAGPDCCTSGGCACACLHSMQAAVPVVTLAPLRVESAGSLRLPLPAHVAPALPDLIRPPIG